MDPVRSRRAQRLALCDYAQAVHPHSTKHRLSCVCQSQRLRSRCSTMDLRRGVQLQKTEAAGSARPPMLPSRAANDNCSYGTSRLIVTSRAAFVVATTSNAAVGALAQTNRGGCLTVLDW